MAKKVEINDFDFRLERIMKLEVEHKNMVDATGEPLHRELSTAFFTQAKYFFERTFKREKNDNN